MRVACSRAPAAHAARVATRAAHAGLRRRVCAARCAELRRKPSPRRADASRGMRARSLARTRVLLCAVAVARAAPRRPRAPRCRAPRAERAARAPRRWGRRACARACSWTPPRFRAAPGAPACSSSSRPAGTSTGAIPGTPACRRSSSCSRATVARSGRWPGRRRGLPRGRPRLVRLRRPGAAGRAACIPARPGALLHARADVLVCDSQCLPAQLRAASDRSSPSPTPARAPRSRALRGDGRARRRAPAAERGVEVEARFARRSRAPRASALDADAAGHALRRDSGGCAAAAPAAGRDAHSSSSSPRPGWCTRRSLASTRTAPCRSRSAGEALPGSEPDAGRAARRAGAARCRTARRGRWRSSCRCPSRTRRRSHRPRRPPPTGLGAWLRALLFGFVGGLVLNLMPCVLPVLALKLVALAELSQRSRREVFGHAAAYTAGIQADCSRWRSACWRCAPAGARSAGASSSRSRSSSPRVAVLLVTFATQPVRRLRARVRAGPPGARRRRREGAARSFFDGLLAVVLATPCSAPFLGTAVGFAFASPAPVCVAIFASIGLGLAAPFVAVSLCAGPRAPRCRAAATWMLELRRGLAFALLLTVVWLLWITGRQSGADAALGLLAAAALRRGRGLALRRGAARARTARRAGADRRGRRDRRWSAQGRIELVAAARRDAPEGVAPYERAALEAALDERPPGLRLLHRRLVPHLQAERAARARHRAARSDELARLGFAVFRADWTLRDAAHRRRAGAPRPRRRAGLRAVCRPAGSTRRACCRTCSRSTPSRRRCARRRSGLAHAARVARRSCRRAAVTALTRTTRSAQRCADPLRPKGIEDDGSRTRERARSCARWRLLTARVLALAAAAGAVADRPARAGRRGRAPRRPGPALARGAEGQGRVPRLLGVLVQAVRALAADPRRLPQGVPEPRTSPSSPSTWTTTRRWRAPSCRAARSGTPRSSIRRASCRCASVSRRCRPRS